MATAKKTTSKAKAKAKAKTPKIPRVKFYNHGPNAETIRDRELMIQLYGKAHQRFLLPDF